MHSSLLITLIFIFLFASTNSGSTKVLLKTVGTLSPDFQQRPNNYSSNGDDTFFHVWRFEGEEIQAFKLWRTVQVVIKFLNSVEADYSIYQNPNKSEVIKAYEENQRFITHYLHKWSSWRPSSYINPFTSTFVGVETDSTYMIRLKYKNVDFLLAGLFSIGIILFFAANKLSRSSLAFYAGGTSVGIIGSLLVLVFILYKLTPKRSAAFTILLGGWSFAAYIGYFIWKNLYAVLTDYYPYVAVYLVSVASISFAISYIRGPPQGLRTLNVIQWLIQIIALVMIYYGSQIPSISMATICIVLVLWNLPSSLGRRLRSIKYKIFPPKRRLLTEDEYFAEGALETTRALDELRRYCQSPDCNSWRTISRLHSPQRFAEFVGGRQSHISDEEILRYSHESEIDDQRESDDEDDESDQIEEEPRTTTDVYNRSFNYPLRGEQNGVRKRYYEVFNDGGSSPASAPGNSLTRLGRYEMRQNRSFTGGRY